MPWKNTSTMDQKSEFITLWESNNYSFSSLCKEFDISRTAGYNIINRYKEFGPQSVIENSRAPFSQPNRTPVNIEQAIVELRKNHKNWGARKFEILLKSQFSEEVIPSVTTIHNILSRNGLVEPRKRIKRVKPVYPIFDPAECNEVWSADFKGKFRMGNKKYCHPLTIADSFSRYVFSAKGMYSENFESVKKEFTRVFREYGMPHQIHTDNGSPFGSTRALKRFTQLSYWFIDLGIMPVFSDPAHPEQNGRHERMHKDLKAECAMPPSFNLTGQQRSLNHFLKEYNNLRPHEAIDMKTPSNVHVRSRRPFLDRIEEYHYPDDIKLQYVTKNGAIRWKAFYWIYMSRALAGKHVGIQEIGNGIWKVFYRDVFLGYINEKLLKDRGKGIRLIDNIV
jgi:transposase InsO family protein